MVALGNDIIQKGFFDKSLGASGRQFFLGRGKRARKRRRPCLSLDPGLRFPEMDEPPGGMPPDDLTGQVHHGGVGVDQGGVAGGDGPGEAREQPLRHRHGRGLDLKAPGGEDLPGAPGQFAAQAQGGVIEDVKGAGGMVRQIIGQPAPGPGRWRATP